MGDPISDLYGSRFSSRSVQSWSERITSRSRGLFRPVSLRKLLSTDERLRPRSTASSSPPPDLSDNISSVDGSVESSFESGFSKRHDQATANIVLVEAKGLPDALSDSAAHSIYCKFQLGAETIKSKSVPSSRHPKWQQRLKIPFRGNQLLQVSVWDKGKHKNFMGSCVVDLSPLEKERTHSLWQNLEDGFGSIHFTVTMCNTIDQNVSHSTFEKTQEKYAWYNLNGDFSIVGELKVKVIAAKGLWSRASAYCVLELDNERVQTHSTRATTEPVWDRTFSFNICNMTSALEVRLYDKSSSMNLLSESILGTVSIPLLRLRSREKRWFALKDKTKRSAAKGNCSRVLLETSMAWNPVKAAFRTFRPKDVKHIPEQNKVDIGQMYTDVEFVRVALDFAGELNEMFKRLFEWDSREQSQLALIIWLLFWLYIEIWMFPLLLVIPFIYFGFVKTLKNSALPQRLPEKQPKEVIPNENQDQSKTLTGRMYDLPDLLGSITCNIAYIRVTAERLKNLVGFKIPFLSLVAIASLLASSALLRALSFNHIMMALGIYKYTRKHVLNPDREPNNDILDFISHVPANNTLEKAIVS